MKKHLAAAAVIIAMIAAGAAFTKASGKKEDKMAGTDKLVVVWTSGDRDVALKMVFMYTLNAKKHGWWDQVRLVVWGPSSKLASEDEEIQTELIKMKEAGVELMACKACADMYGVSEDLEKLGIEVTYMGQPLTEMLKSGWTSMTF